MDELTKQEQFLAFLGICKLIHETEEVIERIPLDNPGGLMGWQDRLEIAISAKNKLKQGLNLSGEVD